MLEYVAILIMISLAALIAFAIVGLSYFLGYKTRAKVKLSPYECGMVSVGPARRRITIRYYIVAMLFLVFDLEILFLYPWAVIMKKLGLFGFMEMIVFVAILFVGYVYVWKKGALEWE
ncbi:MAG: NAD(P)H-quinone oxidoreductase subunit 3 [Syntrophorhabdaceae bacterium PtaU1.Bin034]|nr:MAG: NAD(P)H-quinone oxidoreductase subunit 3 [Syntrophorhabdaceae bacterium PtaU1.Bin034]